jgi:hypothetical protein
MDAITKIFTTEDQQELKQGFKKIILEQFRSDLEKMDVYLFDPSVIEDIIQDAFTEVINEAKVDFKEKLKNQVMNLLENNDIEKLLEIKKRIK